MSSIHSLRKKFVKGYNLPIHVLQDPYFLYLLELYETDFGSRTKYIEFLQSVNSYNSYEDFFQDHNRVLNEVVSYISSSHRYMEFNSQDMSELRKISLSKQNIYVPQNHRKLFLSIDMKEANFNTMKEYGCIPVEDKTYYDFISRFTNNEFFRKSKNLRQMIFGYLNPKRQQILQLHYLDILVNDYLRNFLHLNPIVLGSDEVIFPGITYTDYLNIVSTLSEFTSHPLNAIEDTLFHIRILSEQGNVYVKENFVPDNKRELKNVPNYFYPQYYKYLRGMEINDYDLVFYHDKKLAKFLDINEDLKNS